MGRPPMPLGTHGKIRFYGGGKDWRARTLYRDYDGKARDVERSGESRAAAERALKEALRDRVHMDDTAEINPASKVSVVAEAWWSVFSLSDCSPSTKQVYRGRIDAQIVPALANLRMRELSTGVVERFLRAVQVKHGPSTAKTVRTVLSNICSFATRHDALGRNPVRDTSPISVKPKKGKAKALLLDEVRQLRAALTYDDRARARDLLALVDVLAATGIRLGEALALVWDAIDLDRSTLEVRGTVVRVKGLGLVIKPEPKSDAGYRTLILPSWCQLELDRRYQGPSSDPELVDLVFPSRVGTLRDPPNVDNMLRDAFVTAGFPHITSHIFRKTVATLMDQAGLSPRAGADQLGHSQVTMTMNTYWGRKTADTGAAKVLEALRV